MSDKYYQFQAVIHTVHEKGGAYIEFPYDIRKEFGKGRVKVYAAFDGEPYEGSVVNMGIKNQDDSICYIIGITKAIRMKLNKSNGDIVHVVIYERA